MANENEIIAELAKANEILSEIRGFARFANQVLKIFIVLGVIYLVTKVALVYIASR
jgi:hypothetical protein